jgi:oligopeptide/dipeptide ABC transporter ATP-binding protein
MTPSSSGQRAVLSIRDLRVSFATQTRSVAAVNGVSLDVVPGECLAIVGESGSGKSQTFHAALGLLPRYATIDGSVRIRGTEILGMPERELRSVRGAQIGLVSQDPMNALTPHLRIERQLIEVLTAHGASGSQALHDRARAALESVQLPDAGEALRRYPHELSGGMRQRVALALALIASPEVLIADEPTTALDVTVQAQIVELLRRERERGLAVVFISHDIALVASIADRIAVMYAGRIVETAPAATLCAEPSHPYTRALLRSVPDLRMDRSLRLQEIAGQPPASGWAGAGCAFEPRCPLREEQCRTVRPAATSVGAGREVACHVASREIDA